MTFNTNATFSSLDVSGTFNANSFTGYVLTAASTITLPATASVSYGTAITFTTATTGSVVITANTGQYINIGGTLSMSGGTATSSAKGNSVTLVFHPADSVWYAIAVAGSWSVT